MEYSHYFSAEYTSQLLLHSLLYKLYRNNSTLQEASMESNELYGSQVEEREYFHKALSNYKYELVKTEEIGF